MFEVRIRTHTFSKAHARVKCITNRCLSHLPT